MFWNHCFCLWLKCCCSVAAFSAVCRVVPCVLYAVLLRVPQCSGIKPSACCLLLLLGDAPGKAELRYHVKSQGSSAELLWQMLYFLCRCWILLSLRWLCTRLYCCTYIGQMAQGLRGTETCCAGARDNLTPDTILNQPACHESSAVIWEITPGFGVNMWQLWTQLGPQRRGMVRSKRGHGYRPNEQLHIG